MMQRRGREEEEELFTTKDAERRRERKTTEIVNHLGETGTVVRGGKETRLAISILEPPWSVMRVIGHSDQEGVATCCLNEGDAKELDIEDVENDPLEAGGGEGHEPEAIVL